MAKEHEFAIPVRDLDAGGRSFDLPIPAAWMRTALSDTHVQTGVEEGKLELRLSKSGTDVVVRGSLRADLVVPCARCLEPAKVAVREAVSALVVPSSAMRETAGFKKADDDEGSDGDLTPDQDDVIPYDGETVVLDDLVRDELLLAIPMIPLCSEGCTGISPHPQHEEQPPAEPSIDPRLRPLLRLKQMQNEKSKS
jgi:uncharacterized protein